MTGFIFDLDGVIVDTAKYHYLAWKKLAAELGFDFTEEQNELFKGVSRKRCLEILLELGNVTASSSDFDRWMIQKNEDYLQLIKNMDASEILDGVVPVLDFLKEKNIPIALGSASKNAKPILEKVGLLSYFDVIVDGTHVAKAKPDPEVFLNAASQLGVAPKNCVVFEDAQAGVEAAVSGGMVAISIGDSSVLKGAHYNFNSFSQVTIDFIASILK